MKLSLAELLPLKSTIARQLQEKLTERTTVAFIDFEKGEDKVEEPSKTVKEVSKELREIREDYRKIDYLISKSNVDMMVDWEDGKISISEAIELAKQLRGEAHSLKSLGRSKKMERLHSYRDETPMYRKALFEPEEMMEKAEKLVKKANRLSMLIEKTNHRIEVDFPEAAKYI